MVKMNKIKSEYNNIACSVASAAEEVFFESWFVINLSHAIRDDETLEVMNILAQRCKNLEILIRVSPSKHYICYTQVEAAFG
jgi:hypothetical protein